MKKIAVLTQPLGSNYGGIMQAFALQKVLTDLGHDVITVDRRFYNGNLFFRTLRWLKAQSYGRIKGGSVKRLTKQETLYVLSDMTGFINRNIRISEPIKTSSELKSFLLEKGLDKVVVGSDQVWRPKYSPNIYNYFGDVVAKRTSIVAYAASFGVDHWEYSQSQTERCRELIKRFEAVSVREASGVGLCAKYLGVEAKKVVDPTLLLTTDDYSTLVSNTNTNSENKVLRYVLDESPLTNEVLNKVCGRLNVPCSSAQPNKKMTELNGSIEEYKYPSVENWIASFRDADYVVTDSFHGCVFSLIFNKPFLVIGNRSRGLSRFQSLLSMVDLEDRLILDSSNNLDYLIERDIDWNRVNETIHESRKASLSFIESWI